MLNISQDAVLRTVVPLPPFDLQMRYENLAWSVIHIASQARRRSDEIEGIWANLLQRAFSGQLTANWHKVHERTASRCSSKLDCSIYLRRRNWTLFVDLSPPNQRLPYWQLQGLRRAPSGSRSNPLPDFWAQQLGEVSFIQSLALAHEASSVEKSPRRTGQPTA